MDAERRFQELADAYSLLMDTTHAEKSQRGSSKSVFENILRDIRTIPVAIKGGSSQGGNFNFVDLLDLAEINKTTGRNKETKPRGTESLWGAAEGRAYGFFISPGAFAFQINPLN